MILLPVAILMCGYALLVFVWRAQAIAKEQVWHLFIPTEAHCACEPIVCSKASASPSCNVPLRLHVWLHQRSQHLACG